MSVTVVKATGLAPVKFLAPWGPYNAGEIGGVRPADFMVLTEGGFAEEVSPSEGTETESWDDDRVLADSRRDQSRNKQLDDFKRKDAIEIPDDWAEQHSLARTRLASEIAGTPIPTTELADYTINDELVRRGKAVSLFKRGNVTTGDQETLTRDVNVPALAGFRSVTGGDLSQEGSGAAKASSSASTARRNPGRARPARSVNAAEE